jgi:flagellar basal-body rod protein FlgF
MDRMLFLAMSGAKETALSQANNANNLANASTAGFKKDFNAFLSQEIEGGGLNTRTYTQDSRPATDLSRGSFNQTNRTLDVTLSEGFFSSMHGNTEALSSSMGMSIRQDGMLVDSKGGNVLNAQGAPIVLPPHKSLSIGDDGTISIVPEGAEANQLQAFDQLKITNPERNSIFKNVNGLLTSNNMNNPPQADMKVSSGVLEGSNVSSVEALTNMIELSRNYEMQIKMMRTAKEHSEKSDSILSLR